MANVAEAHVRCTAVDSGCLVAETVDAVHVVTAGKLATGVGSGCVGAVVVDVTKFLASGTTVVICVQCIVLRAAEYLTKQTRANSVLHFSVSRCLLCFYG